MDKSHQISFDEIKEFENEHVLASVSGLHDTGVYEKGTYENKSIKLVASIRGIRYRVYHFEKVVLETEFLISAVTAYNNIMPEKVQIKDGFLAKGEWERINKSR